MNRPIGSFYEFFAGAGMARAGLGDRWRCLFANDFDRKKTATYALNWGEDGLKCGDVRDVSTEDLPDVADLVWASFPCQDLSLAGGGAGLKGERSGTFWPFWGLMTALGEEGRAPHVIVLENVCGTLSSHDGKDFRAICGALRDGGYRFGALVVDASLFVPQSRPRLLVVALRDGVPVLACCAATDRRESFTLARSGMRSAGCRPGCMRAGYGGVSRAPPSPQCRVSRIFLRKILVMWSGIRPPRRGSYWA